MTRSRIALMALLSLAAMTTTMCCKQHRSTASGTAGSQSAAITTGIVGRVEVWEGNFMPPIAPERRANQIKPGAGRRVRVHEAVRIQGDMAQAKRAEVATPVIAEVMADSAGRFAISIPAGVYSIFAEDDGGWYYNGFSTNGIQGEVAVTEGQTTEVVIKIQCKATF